MPHHANEDLFNYRPLTESQLGSYEQKGYLLLGRTLTDQGLDLMRRESMDAWRAERGDFEDGKTWLENSLLPNVHHMSDVIRRYYFDGPLVDAAEKLVGPNVKATSSQLTFKLRGNTQSFAWHQDSSYGLLDPDNAVSTLTALDDVDVKNGCLWLVPGSPSRGLIDVSYTLEDKKQQKSIELEVDESEAVPMPLKSGEALAFHTRMLHKSEGNRSKDRDRRILFVRYSDADSVEVYNDRKPRMGRLLRGQTRFPEVASYEADLE